MTHPFRCHPYRQLFSVLALSFMLLVSAVAFGGQPSVPLPSAQDKCPVCGMFVSKYPDWTAVIMYRGGTRLYFDGPKDMMTFYLNPGKYDATRNRGAITGIFVKDYYSLDFIDARRAYFVVGSDVLGPMGRELIPFALVADAKAFLKDHKGKQILSFTKLTPAVLNTLAEP